MGLTLSTFNAIYLTFTIIFLGSLLIKDYIKDKDKESR